MSIAALMIAFVIAAQVGATGGRYSSTDKNASGANESSAVSPPVTDVGSDGLIREFESPAGVGGTGAAAAADGVDGLPRSQPTAPTGEAQPISPLNNSAAPPSVGAPPPYRSPPPAPSASVGMKPSAMMKEMMKPPLGSQLSGNATRLLEVIAGARTRHEQAHRIEAYWDLCSSVADYYLGVREQDDFRKLPSVLPRAAATLQQAQAEFDVRLDTARLAAVASQRRLASMMGGSSVSLPLPADLPHCGSYQTRYEEIFSVRPSVEAKELAALLSSRYSELKDAATAVTRAQSWIGEVVRNDSGEGIETLRALELLALRRRAFVQIARDYNRRISRYTELSTPGEIGAERLVGMLIKVSAPPTATRPSLPSGTNGRQSRSSTSAPPRTFAGSEGWEPVSQSTARGAARDGSVKPASAEERAAPAKERSLLVSPR
jgi:hypothetical protein